MLCSTYVHFLSVCEVLDNGSNYVELSFYCFQFDATVYVSVLTYLSAIAFPVRFTSFVNWALDNWSETAP